MVSQFMDVRSGQVGKLEKGMTLLEVMLALVLTGLFFCCLLGLTTRGVSLHQRMVEEGRLVRQMNLVRLFVQDRFDNAKSVGFEQEGKRLKKITFDGKYTLQVSKEATLANDLYKMTYESQTLVDNIEWITMMERGNWVYVDCTLRGRGGMRITETILLNRMYKQ